MKDQAIVWYNDGSVTLGPDFEEVYMEIIARYIHGSQDSIDRDVLYIVDRLPSFGDCVDFLCGGQV